MRIVYLTQWFEPEPNIVKGISFVHALEAAGHRVTVVTGFPNYPTGKLYPGYRLRVMRREIIDGVSVIRLPLYPSHDSSALRRSANYLTFFLSVLVYCLFRTRRYDLAYVYHPPITVGLAAALAGSIRRLPFALDIQDLWPDTVAATGMTGAARIAGWLNRVCTFVYGRASAIIVQSEGMRRALVARGVPAAKVTTLRNWADVEGMAAEPAREHEAGRPFTLVYGGNLGRAQALETVVDAAEIAEREPSDLQILIYGDGIDAASLRERAQRLKVKSLRFEERVSKDGILKIFAQADALLLHLRDDPLFAITVPSKVQFYLAMGKPIIAGIAGEAADLLRESGAAIVVPPGDADAMAQAIFKLAALSPEQRKAMGEEGRRYYRENLSIDRGIVRTLRVLEGIYSEK
ncbi:MAG: glycosyltransferase family 4 protein [Sphingomonadales bacterium]